MSWLDKQTHGLAKEWIRNTAAAMLATKPDGEILWANNSFEKLLGYSSPELIGKLSWKDLTEDEEVLKSDEQLVLETINGERTSYQLHKRYRTRGGPSLSVIIDVLRYPIQGDFECFLVTVFPVNRNADFTLGQMEEFRKLLLEILQHQPSGLTFAKTWDWAKEHPIVASITGLLAAVFLFGERVLEIVAKVIELRETL
ncbi:PAS domain S-box protein [Rhodopirellula halodulae]|uniref:PAS domain S-box protein n=1 Tax=Rhodopirellula halodulae TaxID=2894198 RepID=UPI001E47159F|nr:PAS domain-containing protein [Rhodopirellula sp. JC737]MCC9655303.1 PAS domain-containing protein [Rhodopirellula sp. JC737]